MIISFDKTTWKKYELKYVVSKRKNTIDLSERKIGDKYIAGEHFNKKNFHINSFGTVDENYLGPAFNTKFLDSDTLYLSRNPQLQKVALPGFEGICANTTFVLYTIAEKMRNDLLPFLLISNSFTSHAVKNKRGSTNFYVNWSDINSYEFKLPELGKQKILSDLLWCTNNLLESYTELKNAINQHKRALSNKFFNKNNENTQLFKDLILEIGSGGTPSTKNKDFYQGSIPWVTSILLGEKYISKGEKYITEKAIDNSAAKLYTSGTLMLGSRVGVGRVSIAKNDISCSQDVVGIKTNESKIIQDYLYHHINSEWTQYELIRRSQGTTIKGITISDLMKIPLIVPSKEDQQLISQKFDDLDSMLKKIDKAEKLFYKIHNEIIDKIF